MKKDFEKYIAANEVRAIDTLGKLVSIRSVKEDPVTTGTGEVFPFGKGVQDAFSCFLSEAEEFGFVTENIDNYGGHIDFGSGEETVGIVGHLDVVPEGGEWDFEPFSGEVKDGFILGRGTTDDKGPLTAALFAMKSLKDAGYEPDRRIRMIIGLDEETDWSGMEYYLDRVKAPDFGITPDSDFPVIYAEKGMMVFEIAKMIGNQDKNGLTLRKMSGSQAFNIVPENGRALVNHPDRKYYDRIEETAEAYKKETGREVKIRRAGASLEITAAGRAAHGSAPERGINAVSILFDFLGRLCFADEKLNEFIDFYNKKIGFTTDGSGLGVACSDERSGALTLNTGVVRFDGNVLSVSCDVRFPVTFNKEELYEKLMPFVDEYQVGVVKGRSERPLYFDPEGRFIQMLMNVYRENTGDLETAPIATGGATYAKACPNVAAFGGLFPGDPNCMHQKNEKLSVERFCQMIRIYTDVIYRMSSSSFVFDGD